MKLLIDMETRSRVDLKKTGVYPYAEHKSTDILCIAVKVDDKAPGIWVNEDFFHILRGQDTKLPLIDPVYMVHLAHQVADGIHAHNVQFERVMWQKIMVERYGFAPISFEKWRDTAAKAAAHALPRDLFRACKVLGLSEQKDMTGHRIMMKMCKPKRNGEWHEDAQDFLALCHYCLQDVESEYALDQVLYDLSSSELEVWRLDQIVNDRGIQIDVPAIRNLIYKIQEKERLLLAEVPVITNGAIESVRQVEAMREWLQSQGLDLPDLTKDTVADALTKEVTPKIKRLLQIRQSLAKSSVSKFATMLRMVCRDGRVRGVTLYHAASTGRFGGRGIQPQNLPRASHGSEAIEAILQNGIAEVEKVSGNCVIQEASKCIRGMLIAKKGHTFICTDYASIEAIKLAWIAGEEKVLQDFRNGLDLYKTAAMDVYKKSYEDINTKERFVGKTIVLACGYQGWVNAFRQIGSDEVNQMSDEEIAEIIGAWRGVRVATVRFWRGVEAAALQTVQDGKPHSYGRVKFGIRGRFLHCRLPSGRILSYYNPSIRNQESPYGKMRRVVSFMGVNSMTHKWERQYTYGGKLTENIVQALSRDTLVEAMKRVEQAKFPIVLHVHDEIMAEVPLSWGQSEEKVAEFERLMTQVPTWAPGCPIKAESWIGGRYRKG